MIDHVSIAVRDLAAAARFYEAVLGVLGLVKLRDWPASVGFGKKYPEFWLNLRPDFRPAADPGAHVCLRALDKETVDRFHAAALEFGGTTDGAPGMRPHYNAAYYAAFIRDPDGNRIEVVTFITPAA
jgi:catechol 2,3-dioxygenase-like lactoylglutathione lyase family enzyme